MALERRFKPGIYVSQSPSRCSIVLKNVFKTHNNRNVLDGVNLTAHSGKICAIFGEINSGKSMLLSCLVGGDKVDKGHIWVLGGKPRTKSSKTLTKYAGYMPQEICLYKTMTVLELFAYFGNLYNINHTFILWRISYYKDIFTLPPINSTIKNLSFSEKRMISFIIAVFHRPRLVVLDEPTVGLDILKQNQVWKYLCYIMTTWKPTVVVATNNIEEAFLATKIACLKDGKIMEREVEELHRTYPNKSVDLIIEDLYTNVLFNNIKKHSWINSNHSETPQNKELSICKQIIPRSNIWKFKTIIIQYMKFSTKNIWIFLLFWVIPILQVYMHCTYYGKYPDCMTIAVYNQEADCAYDQCIHIENCSYFSCHFVYVLNQHSVKMNYYGSELVAKNSIRKGSTLGLMKVPKNYTIAMINSITQSSSSERDELLKSNINVEIDMSNFEFGEHLKQHFLNAHKQHLIEVYGQYNLSTKYAEIPLKIYELNNLNLTENTASEIISCSIFSSAMFYFSLLLQSEIQNGYLVRNVIAGVTIFEIVLSFLTVQIIFSIFQAFSLFFLADFLLNIRWESSLLLIIQLNIVIGTCGMSIGLFIGSFANSSIKSFYATLFVYLINIMLCGLFWPLDNTELALRPVSTLLPLSMPIRAVRAILIQGRKFNPEDIILAAITITFWTLVTFTTFILKFSGLSRAMAKECIVVLQRCVYIFLTLHF